MSPHPRSAILILRPIGIIRTKYTRTYETPRQPALTREHTEGRIILFPSRNFEQALEGLRGFDRVWIIGLFNRACGWKTKILPPRGRTKQGVFATRSPHRPNPIGISSCRLLSIRGRTLIVENPDFLDKTPILDIKPYIPSADAFPDAAIGWLDPHLRVGESPYRLSFLPRAVEQLGWLVARHGVDLKSQTETVLGHDPWPHPYRRTKALPGGFFALAVRSWRVVYSIDGGNVTVHEVMSGYTPEALVHPGVDNGAAHREFLRKWGNRQT